MSVSIYTLFNLKNNYNRDDLYRAYSAKMDEINKSNLNPVDKLFMTENINEMYYKARSALLEKETREAQKQAQQNYLNLFNNDYFLSSYYDTFNRLMESRINLFNKQIDEMSNKLSNNNTVQGSTRSYNEKLLPDGSRLIVESVKTNKNGNIEENTTSYKRHKDGRTEPVVLDEALKMLK